MSHIFYPDTPCLTHSYMSLYSVDFSSPITHMNQSDWFLQCPVTDYLLGANRKPCFEHHMIQMDAKEKQMERDG